MEELRHSRSIGGIVLGDGGTVAMVRRQNSNGAWLFPKGHPEPGEEDEQAARREIAEESGITDLELIDDLGSYERHPILPDGSEDRSEMKEIHMYLFAAPHGAELHAATEMDGAKWVPLSQVVDTCGNATDRAWFVRVFERVRQAIQRD
jgi:8-oxo-dGTP pyrophosphatase MutT (NUDIX family)